ncbi:hypothetical protein C8Q80DRAFT_23571 [Daedaleopsis nitida]|nr:hypothetical protein C8Q80DRAFT_23571 [Daedaleopsis nitida]
MPTTHLTGGTGQWITSDVADRNKATRCPYRTHDVAGLVYPLYVPTKTKTKKIRGARSSQREYTRPNDEPLQPCHAPHPERMVQLRVRTDRLPRKIPEAGQGDAQLREHPRPLRQLQLPEEVPDRGRARPPRAQLRLRGDGGEVAPDGVERAAEDARVCGRDALQLEVEHGVGEHGRGQAGERVDAAEVDDPERGEERRMAC